MLLQHERTDNYGSRASYKIGFNKALPQIQVQYKYNTRRRDEPFVYMQIQTDKEIDPQEVVAYRTDVADEFNTIFLNDDELEQLW